MMLADAPAPACDPAVTAPARDLSPTAGAPRVWLCDPFCFTPWYTAELALALARAGVRVDLRSAPFAREPGYFAGRGLAPEGGPLRLSGHLRRAPAPLQRVVRTAEVLLGYRALAREMGRHAATEPALLHLQQTPLLSHGIGADLRLIARARASRIPVVHTVHNLLPHDSGNRMRSRYRELYRAVDHLLCHSEEAARSVAELSGVPADRITVIPHGPLFPPPAGAPVSGADHRAAREALGLPHGRLVFLCQGILAPYKGLDVLLDAWHLCLERCRAQRIPPPLLVIAGSGPAKLVATVRARALALGDSVRADLRYLPSALLPRYFAAADVFVYPYRRITTSGALLSGLSYGKPILASELPVFAEFLTQGENALLTPPGDAVALAGTLFLLARESAAAPRLPAGDTLARLAAGARHNGARCTSWSEIGRRTAALYRLLTQAAVGGKGRD